MPDTFRAIPLTIVPLIIFNLVGLLSSALDPWATVLLDLPMFSGRSWLLTLGDLMIIVGLALLFVEVLRSSRPSRYTITNHIMSTAVLIIYIVEFIVAGIAANSVFFILTIMALFDVVAGFTVSIKSAQRDVTFGTPMDHHSTPL